MSDDYYEEKYGPRVTSAALGRYLVAKGIQQCSCGKGRYVVEVDGDGEGEGDDDHGDAMAFIGGLLNPPQTLIFLSYVVTCDYCADTKFLSLEQVAAWALTDG